MTPLALTHQRCREKNRAQETKTSCTHKAVPAEQARSKNVKEAENGALAREIKKAAKYPGVTGNKSVGPL